MAFTSKKSKQTLYVLLTAVTLCIVSHYFFRTQLYSTFSLPGAKLASARAKAVHVHVDEAIVQDGGNEPHPHAVPAHMLGYLLVRWNKHGDPPPLGLLA